MMKGAAGVFCKDLALPAINIQLDEQHYTGKVSRGNRLLSRSNGLLTASAAFQNRESCSLVRLWLADWLAD